MKNKILCVIIIFLSCLIFIGNFTYLNAYTTENYSIDIPQNFKRTKEKIRTSYKKGDEKDISIVSIPRVETVEEYLAKRAQVVKLEVVEINGYKAFFSQRVDEEGIYNGGYNILTDNYDTVIIIHSKTNIEGDQEIKQIVSSIQIKDTTNQIKAELENYKIGKTIIKIKMKLWPFILIMVIIITIIIIIILKRKNHQKHP